MADNRDPRRAPEPPAPEMTELAPRVMTPADAMQERQRQMAREASRAPGGARDATVPGGRYRNESGDLVDANGEPLGKGD